MVPGVGATVEGVNLAGELCQVGVGRCWFPVDYSMATGAKSVDDHFDSASDRWVDGAAAVVGQHCE